MLNKYPLWKYLLVLFFVLVGLFYAAPNLYAPDPALQVAGQSSSQLIDDKTLDRALAALDDAAASAPTVSRRLLAGNTSRLNSQML